MKSRLLSGASAVAFCLALTLTACDSDQTLPTEPTVTGETGGETPDFRVVPTDLTNPDADSWTFQPEFDLSFLLSPSSLAAIGTLTPAELVDTLAAGETVTEEKTASLPAQADVVDILFAFDNTGSMGGELDNLKVNAVDIMNSLAGLISDVQFGLISFADYDAFLENTESVGGCGYSANYGGTGDDPYIVEQPLDPNISTVASAIGALTLSPGGGFDFPESYSRALWEIAQELLDNTGPDGPVDWRPNARRIVILFGDAIPHSCDLFNPVESAIGSDLLAFLEGAGLNDWGIDPGRDVVIGTADDLAILDVIDDLVETDLTLISLHSTQFIITGTDVEPTQNLWDFYAEETGGVNFEINEDGSFPEGTDIVETILELVGDQITTVDELILDVCPGDESYADWISSVTPSSYADIDLPADRDFNLVVGPPSGTDPGVYAFGVCAIGDGAVLGSQSVTITVPGATDPTADVSVTKEDALDPVQVGDNINWTITVENAGPDAATTVTVSDVMPAGVTYVSATPSTGSCSEAGGTVTCDLGNLASGATATIAVTATADAAGDVANTATVSNDLTDPNENNNSATETTTVNEPPPPGDPMADLVITKGDQVDPVFVGDEITWALSVSNKGPDEATAVSVTDELPAGVTYVSATPAAGSCSETAGTVTCDLGTIASGSVVGIVIVATADAAGEFSNTAMVSGDQADPNPGDNSATETTDAVEPPEPGECVVVDFENSGSHLEIVSSFALGEATVSISVEPGGARSQAAAALYDTDMAGGPDPDLEWDGGTCAGCEGQGNVLMIADIAIATGGDSEDGGVIVLTGLPAGGYGLASLVAFDSDGKAFTVEVDGGEVGQTTPGADGNVQGLVLDANVITGEVRIDLNGDSGAVDDLEFCPTGN
jgi:uncharacterized repeat protein (TIGR01451 family)